MAEPALGGGRRAARLQRHLRLPRPAPLPAAGPPVRQPRLRAALRHLLGHDRQPPTARRRALRPALHGGDPLRGPGGGAPLPDRRSSGESQHRRRPPAAGRGPPPAAVDRLHPGPGDRRADLPVGDPAPPRPAGPHQLLPGRLPARGAPADRVEAALRGPARGGEHLRPGARHRHRRTRRLRPRGLPRVDRRHLAAGRPRRPPGARVPRRPAGRPGRPRPVLRQAPGAALRPRHRGRRGRSLEPLRPRPAPALRRPRAAADRRRAGIRRDRRIRGRPGAADRRRGAPAERRRRRLVRLAQAAPPAREHALHRRGLVDRRRRAGPAATRGLCRQRGGRRGRVGADRPRARHRHGLRQPAPHRVPRGRHLPAPGPPVPHRRAPPGEAADRGPRRRRPLPHPAQDGRRRRRSSRSWPAGRCTATRPGSGACSCAPG